MNNNATSTASSLFQKFRIVIGLNFFELRSLACHREIQVEETAAAVVVGVVDEDDLEAGPPEEAVEETNNAETNRAVRSSSFEKALSSILPPFPSSFFVFTLPGLFALLQIKWHLPNLVFLHKWYIVCITSLITEFVASITQWIISELATHGL